MCIRDSFWTALSHCSEQQIAPCSPSAASPRALLHFRGPGARWQAARTPCDAAQLRCPGHAENQGARRLSCRGERRPARRAQRRLLKKWGEGARRGMRG
eukprot:4950416-Pyramimonas_sp.AAC.1